MPPAFLARPQPGNLGRMFDQYGEETSPWGAASMRGPSMQATGPMNAAGAMPTNRYVSGRQVYTSNTPNYSPQQRINAAGYNPRANQALANQSAFASRLGQDYGAYVNHKLPVEGVMKYVDQGAINPSALTGSNRKAYEMRAAGNPNWAAPTYTPDSQRPPAASPPIGNLNTMMNAPRTVQMAPTGGNLGGSVTYGGAPITAQASPQEAQLMRMRAQGFGPEVLAMQQEWNQSNFGQNGRPTPLMDRNLQEYGGVQGANRYFSQSPAYLNRR